MLASKDISHISFNSTTPNLFDYVMMLCVCVCVCVCVRTCVLEGEDGCWDTDSFCKFSETSQLKIPYVLLKVA